MAPLSSDEARRRFRAALNGERSSRRGLSVAKAKAQLRAVDAELDIGPLLDAVSHKQWRSATLSLVIWLNTDAGRAFIAPLMMKLLPLVISLLGLFGQRKGHGHPTAAPAEKDEPEV